MSSPFQLLMAISSVDSRSVNSRSVLVIHNVELDGFRDLVSSCCFLVRVKPKWVLADLYFLYYRFISFLYDEIYVGDIRSVYFNYITQKVSSSRVLVLDDGSASIGILNRLDEGIDLNVSSKNIFKRILFKILGLKIKNVDISGFRYQTIFDTKIEDDRVSVEKLNSAVTASEGVKESYFLGGKYVDLGFMSIDEYLKAIERALNIDKSLVYIVHRAESDIVLKSIQERFPALEVRKHNTCIEYVILKEGIQLDNLFSIYSTALFTLMPFCKGKVHHYTIGFSSIPDHHRYNVQKVYEQLELLGSSCYSSECQSDAE